MTGYTSLTMTCRTCRWTAGRTFTINDGWDLDAEMCSLCIAESEGRPDPEVQEAS